MPKPIAFGTDRVHIKPVQTSTDPRPRTTREAPSPSLSCSAAHRARKECFGFHKFATTRQQFAALKAAFNGRAGSWMPQHNSEITAVGAAWGIENDDMASTITPDEIGRAHVC